MVRVTVSYVSSEGLDKLVRTAPALEIPPARTLRWPVGPKPARIGNFTLKARGYTTSKQPLATSVYGVDLVDWLAEAGTSLKEVSVATRGVKAAADPVIQGTVVAVELFGMSALSGAPNSCTFRFTCVDGQEADATIYFEKG